VGLSFQDPTLQCVETTVTRELLVAGNLQRWSVSEKQGFVEVGLSGTKLGASDSPLDLVPQQLRFLSIYSGLAKVSCVIFDEPTNGLDAEGRLRLVHLIRELLANGMAVVIVTHDNELAALADRTVFFAGGRIGSPSQSAEP